MLARDAELKYWVKCEELSNPITEDPRMYHVYPKVELKVEIVKDAEDRDYYSDVISREHYLQSSAINVNTLVQVAKRGNEILGIITWEPATRKWFGFRDELIGWTKDQKRTRLKYCFENRRFLMLKDEKNLASSILKKSLNQLVEESEELYGHGCLLAETFVDPGQGLSGTCYKAAGWCEAGRTKGGRGEDTRTPKKYFIKEVKKDALGKLKSPKLTPGDTKNPRQKILSLDTFDIKGLRSKLNEIPDPRKHKGWFPFNSLLALTIMAVLSGESTISDIHRWVSSLSTELIRSLGCRKHPSYGVLRSTLIKVDHQTLSKVLCKWLEEQERKVHIDKRVKILALDGKHIRAASRAKGADIHILELVDSVTQVVKAQFPVSDKENEIPVAQEMLVKMPINAGTIITADALHTQKKTAEIIIKKTPTMYSQLKATKKISNEQLSKKPKRKIGRFSTVQKSLGMDG